MGQELCSAPVLLFYPVEDLPCLAWLPPVAAVLCCLPQAGPGKGKSSPCMQVLPFPPLEKLLPCNAGPLLSCEERAALLGIEGHKHMLRTSFFIQTAWANNLFSVVTISLLKQCLRTGEGLDSTSSCMPGPGALHAELSDWVPAAEEQEGSC